MTSIIAAAAAAAISGLDWRLSVVLSVVKKATLLPAIGLLLAFGSVGSSTGHAALVLAVSESGASAISGTVGQTLSIPIFLFDTDNPSVLTVEGLQSFGTAATFTPSLLSVNAISLNTDFDFLPDSQFDNGPGTLSFFAATLVNPPPSTNPIQLATIDVSLLQAGTTTIEFADLDSGFADFASGGSQDLDPLLFGPAFNQVQSLTVNISAVPEPAGATAFALASMTGVLLWRRRQRFSKTTVSAPQTCSLSI